MSAFKPAVRARIPALCALLLPFTACTGAGGTPPPTASETSAPAETSGKNEWAGCYAAFEPSGNAHADLTTLTRACSRIGNMHNVTPVTTGEQKETDPADRYMFHVPKAGACYRVFAAGDSGIKDLDLLLRGPTGDDVVGDITHDSWPILPPERPVCFEQPGLYMLEVSVYRGSGRYALQVWGN